MRLWANEPIPHGMATESVDAYCCDCDQQSWTVIVQTDEAYPRVKKIEQRCDCKVNPTFVKEFLLESVFRKVLLVEEY